MHFNPLQEMQDSLSISTVPRIYIQTYYWASPYYFL
uniref:Uncharacterized protein n=1 Tax=Rhizophora mucronata TaxID=61149 RepID=A0A2P2QCS4_RHIMU